MGHVHFDPVHASFLAAPRTMAEGLDRLPYLIYGYLPSGPPIATCETLGGRYTLLADDIRIGLSSAMLQLHGHSSTSLMHCRS